MFRKIREEDERSSQWFTQAKDSMTDEDRKVEAAVDANRIFSASGVRCKMFYNIYNKSVLVSILKEDVSWLDRNYVFENMVRRRVKEIFEHNLIRNMPVITLEYVNSL